MHIRDAAGVPAFFLKGLLPEEDKVPMPRQQKGVGVDHIRVVDVRSGEESSGEIQ